MVLFGDATEETGSVARRVSGARFLPSTLRVNPGADLTADSGDPRYAKCQLGSLMLKEPKREVSASFDDIQNFASLD